ncbi:MAG: VOC family protein [Caldilineaceae bacterium]
MRMNEVIPFLAVKNMATSIAFYVDGLGFAFKHKWEDAGVLRWCQLQLGQASLMLQQFATEGHDARHFSDNRGEGVALCFFCDDAIAFYREVSARGINAPEPRVGNGLWVMQVRDPDGYELLFESPTDVAEDTRLSEIEHK